MSGKVVKGARELSRELARLGSLSDEKFLAVVKKLSFDGFKELVIRTPVATGFAQSNWRVGINATDEGALRASATGSMYAPAVYGNPAIEIGDVVHLYNNVVYIKRLEEGWSGQAPQGMVQPTYSRLNTIAAQLADYVSRERIG